MESINTGLQIGLDSMIYATETSHNDLPVIVFSLGDIVSASRGATSKDERLFEKLYERWEKVYRDCDGASHGYNLVILSVDDHGASGAPGQVNRFGWLMWRLRSVKYEFRKNVKKIYIVYPSWLTRVFMPLFLPLVSSKAYAKIQYTRSLRSLYRVHGVSLAGIKLSIPLLYTEANAIQESRGSSTRGSRPPSMIDGITSMLGKVLGAVPFLPKWDEEAESDRLDRDGRALLGSLDEFISSEPAPIPRILLELREVILSEPCNKTEGIFRRSSNSPLSGVLSILLALPDEVRPVIPWQVLALDNPLLPPVKLQGILDAFSSPIIPPQLYPAICQTTTISDLQSRIFPLLSASDQRILAFLAQLIVDLLPFEPNTKMSAKAIGICFAPTLTSGPDQVQDAAMCLAPSQKLPAAMTQGHDLLPGDGTVVGMLMLWAEHLQTAGKDG